jgi:hypothetical protein
MENCGIHSILHGEPSRYLCHTAELKHDIKSHVYNIFYVTKEGLPTVNEPISNFE